MWRDLVLSRELAWRLIVRDISAQYRQTVLGYFWAVFPPLVTTAVFILLKSSAMLNIQEGSIPYPAFVFTGTVFFQLFVDALNGPIKTVTEAKSILVKINLPREAFILSGMGQVLFGFVIKLVLLFGVLLYFRVPLKITALFVPVPMMALLLLGTMLGVILLPLGLLYRDIRSMLLIVTHGLVFVTPVAYTSEVGGLMGRLMELNPVSPLLMGAKEVMLEGIPDQMGSFWLVTGISLFLLFLGWVVYRLSLPYIIERMGG
jgi:lipopolysaccharide transport system permease protein